MAGGGGGVWGEWQCWVWGGGWVGEGKSPSSQKGLVGFGFAGRTKSIGVDVHSNAGHLLLAESERDKEMARETEIQRERETKTERERENETEREERG